jgi:colanic acid biosynthesis glycosyl transferase WcaI
MLIDCDLYAITQQTGSGAAFFPSKLLPALALGKPVLAVADAQSELAVLVREHSLGALFPPDNAPAVAQGITELSEQPRRLAGFCDGSRKLADDYDRNRVHARFMSALESVEREFPVRR